MRNGTLHMLIALGMALCGTMAVGQQKTELDLRIGFSPALDPAGRKMAFSILHDLDPTASISFSTDGDLAKYRSLEVQDPAAVRQALLDAGIAAKVSFSGTTAAIGDTRQLPAGFPVYQATGDPVSDEAVYQAAKEAWILAHPELYEGLTGSPDAMEPSKDE